MSHHRICLILLKFVERGLSLRKALKEAIEWSATSLRREVWSKKTTIAVISSWYCRLSSPSRLIM
ncbi:hypothetical protein AAHE18_09G169300 [Arachis hypogaea]